jgi:putative ABC transport system substrate-binding protein
MAEAGAQPTPLFQGFLQGLRELGWVEGHNLAIEWRFSEGRAEPLPRLAAELVALPVDLIVASGARPASAAKEATGTIPVVFVQVPDPVGLGIVPNLGRPGANVTGLSSIAADLTGKRLALVKEVLPDATRIAVLWNRPNEAAAFVFREMKRSKAQVGLELEDVGVSDRSEVPDAVAAAARARVAAIMVLDDPVIVSYRSTVVRSAAGHALPVFSHIRSTWTKALSCPMGRACWRTIGAEPSMSTASSRVPSRATCRWSRPWFLSWWSTCGRRRRLGSSLRPRWSPAPTG